MILTTITILFFAFRIADGSASIACSVDIEEFNLIDTSVSPSIVTDLTSTVDLSDSSTCSFNIEASLSDSPDGCETKAVKCVKFFLDGVEVHKDNSAPFMYEDDVVGTHTLKACTYSDDACTMDESGCKETNIEFLDCDRSGDGTSAFERRAQSCTASKVTSFKLVNTESPYFPVVTTFTPPIINLLDFPTCALNIYATVSKGTCGPPVKCVKLTLGGQVRKEVSVPYALYGNTGRFIRSGKPDLGAQTLTACTYTDDKCKKGKAGCLSLDVYVKDCVAMSM